MKWKIVYYNRSVEHDACVLEKTIKAKYVAITNMMLEYGPDLGLPHTRAMGRGLFEIRAKGQPGIARGFFARLLEIPL